MSGDFQKKTSSVVVTIFVFIIILAFIITGYQSGGGGVGSIGKVGPYEIKAKEYQSQLNALLDNYARLTGGKPLTSQQIKMFKLKEQAYNSVVNSKLMLILADKLGVHASESEIKAEIEKFPAFQVNKKFSPSRYKLVLANNNIIPSEFESQITESILVRKTADYLQAPSVSENYVQTINNLKKDQIEVSAVQFSTEDFRKDLEVDQKKIQEYLSKNEGKVKTVFDSKKPSLSKTEKVRASHILLRSDAKNDSEVKKKIEDLAKKITPSNFATYAKKHSEDGSKVKGGDLNWFERGRMVPEFDKVAFSLKKGEISKPIKTQFGYHIIYVVDRQEPEVAKFDDHKNSIAKELIQNTMNKELDELVSKKSIQIKNYLVNNNSKKLDQLQDDYSIQYAIPTKINQLSTRIGSLNVRDNQLQKLFNEKDQSLFEFKEDKLLTIVSVTNRDLKKEEGEKVEQEKSAIAFSLSNQLRQGIIESLKSSVKVTNPRIQL